MQRSHYFLALAVFCIPTTAKSSNPLGFTTGALPLGHFGLLTDCVVWRFAMIVDRTSAVSLETSIYPYPVVSFQPDEYLYMGLLSFVLATQLQVSFCFMGYCFARTLLRNKLTCTIGRIRFCRFKKKHRYYLLLISLCKYLPTIDQCPTFILPRNNKPSYKHTFLKHDVLSRGLTRVVYAESAPTASYQNVSNYFRHTFLYESNYKVILIFGWGSINILCNVKYFAKALLKFWAGITLPVLSLRAMKRNVSLALGFNKVVITYFTAYLSKCPTHTKELLGTVHHLTGGRGQFLITFWTSLYGLLANGFGTLIRIMYKMFKFMNAQPELRHS